MRHLVRQLGWVEYGLRYSTILPSCSATSANFTTAQAETGRAWKSQNQPNHTAWPDALPCTLDLIPILASFQLCLFLLLCCCCCRRRGVKHSSSSVVSTPSSGNSRTPERHGSYIGITDSSSSQRLLQQQQVETSSNVNYKNMMWSRI